MFNRLLVPVSGVLELAALARSGMYRAGILRTRRLDVPVISVGNITLGGTGKTPLVETIAASLKEAGLSPAVLSRGYRGRYKQRIHLVSDAQQVLSTWQTCGDEPYMLARHLPGIPVLVSKNRFLAGEFARRMLGANVLVLDDGYQHLPLERDLNILVMDCTNPLGGGKLPPLGRLREPKTAMKRADMIVLSRSHIPHDEVFLRKVIKRYNPQAWLYHCKSRPVRFCRPDGKQHCKLEDLKGVKVVVFCGLGNPRPFMYELERLGLRIEVWFRFRDHHPYRQKEMDQVSRTALDAGARYLVTTEKDAIRLPACERIDPPIVYLESEVIIQEEAGFRACLQVPGGRVVAKGV